MPALQGHKVPLVRGDVPEDLTDRGHHTLVVVQLPKAVLRRFGGARGT